MSMRLATRSPSWEYSFRFVESLGFASVVGERGGNVVGEEVVGEMDGEVED